MVMGSCRGNGNGVQVIQAVTKLIPNVVGGQGLQHLSERVTFSPSQNGQFYFKVRYSLKEVYRCERYAMEVYVV